MRHFFQLSDSPYVSVNVLCLRTVLADSTDRSLRGMSEPLNGSGHTEMHYQKGSITWKMQRKF